MTIHQPYQPEQPDSVTTSSICSAESGASPSASSGQGCEPQPSVRSNPSAAKSSPGTGPAFPFTTTSERSMPLSMSGQLTLFAEDTLASPSAQRASSKVKKTRAISGRKCTESFGRHAPAGSLPRMFADMLALVSTPLPHNWKMTVSPSGRLLFQRALSAPRIAETGSGFWPTIRASEGEKPEGFEAGQRRWEERRTCQLSTAVRLWPTASARDWKDTPGMARTRPDGKSRTDQLARAVYAEMWPTPKAMDADRCSLWVQQRYNAQTGRKNLKSAVGDSLLQSGAQPTGQLNPMWVEGLMGFPAGWTDLT
jgi:hypothetical protein